MQATPAPAQVHYPPARPLDWGADRMARCAAAALQSQGVPAALPAACALRWRARTSRWTRRWPRACRGAGRAGPSPGPPGRRWPPTPARPGGAWAGPGPARPPLPRPVSGPAPRAGPRRPRPLAGPGGPAPEGPRETLGRRAVPHRPPPRAGSSPARGGSVTVTQTHSPLALASSICCRTAGACAGGSGSRARATPPADRCRLGRSTDGRGAGHSPLALGSSIRCPAGTAGACAGGSGSRAVTLLADCCRLGRSTDGRGAGGNRKSRSVSIGFDNESLPRERAPGHGRGASPGPVPDRLSRPHGASLTCGYTAQTRQ